MSPVAAPTTPSQRNEGENNNTHPRRDGSLILAPWDALEGLGDFVRQDALGNPEGFALGFVENPDGRFAYAGSAPDATVRQNSSPLPAERSSFMASQPLVIEGASPPAEDSPYLADLPRPQKPTVRKFAVGVEGYVASTPQSPHWVAFSYVKDVRHGPLGPATPLQLANGQSFRVELPGNAPDRTMRLGIWMSEPGTSLPGAPGRMWLQRIVDLDVYQLPYYDMTGPYRHERPEPEDNETKIAAPDVAPVMSQQILLVPTRSGPWYARVVWTDEQGSTLPGPAAGPIEVVPVPSLAEDFDPTNPSEAKSDAGWGDFTIYRPSPPEGATGWYLYLEIAGKDYRAWERDTYAGRNRPFPLEYRSFTTAGWEASDRFGQNDRGVVMSESPPEEDTTGLGSPDAPPAAPTVFGAARPPAGTYYWRQGDSLGTRESLPSEPASITIGSNEMMVLQFSDEANAIPNGTFSEVGSTGIPLHHTVTQTGGTVYVDDSDLILETTGVQTGATPTHETDWFDVDPTRGGVLEVNFELYDPSQGAPAGNFAIILREIDAGGATWDRVIHKRPTKETGGKQVDEDVEFRSDTKQAKVTTKFASDDEDEEEGGEGDTGGSTSKNGGSRIKHMRMRRQRIKHRHKMRKRLVKLLSLPHVYLPESWLVLAQKRFTPQYAAPPIPPPADTRVEPAPNPPVPPELAPVEGLDRPYEAGEVLESLSYESGSLPGAPWTTTQGGGGGLSVQSVAALSGTQGLRALKSTGGVLSSAYLSKVFSSAGRHDLALSTRLKVPVFAGTGYVDFARLCRPGDGAAVAWLRFARQAEVTSLKIIEPPSVSGSVGVVLNGVKTNVAITAIKEVATLTFTSNPTASGTIAVGLDGVPTYYEVSGQKEQVVFGLSGSAQVSGLINFFLGNEAGTDRLVQSFKITAGTSAVQAAYIVARDWLMPGWTVARDGATLTFTATSPGPRVDAGFGATGLGIGATITTVVQGAGETKEQLAARIRDNTTPPNGWIVSGSGAQVIYTAQTAGARADATYAPGTTGASATITPTTQGSQDTPAQVATKIRAATFTGWTKAGTDNEVIFSATAVGAKLDAHFLPQGTGVVAELATTTQGSDRDVFLNWREANGNVYYRKILGNLSTADIANLELAVVGADAEGKEAGVYAWASLNANPKQMMARFPEVDLTGYPLGIVQAGVISESSSALTWTLYLDDTLITNRGVTYPREHNERGEYLGQVYGSYLAGMPRQDGRPFEGGAWAVIPGTQYALGAFARYAGVPADKLARPLELTAVLNDGTLLPMGDVLAGLAAGVVGSAAWQPYEHGVVVPEKCYELRVRSTGVSEGEYVIQELTCTPGTAVDRSYTYATAGFHRATLDIRTPQQAPFSDFGRERILLATDLSIPEGTSAVPLYRGGSPDPASPYYYDNQIWQPDPASVPPFPILQADIDMSGDGRATPAVKTGSPKAEYRLLSGGDILSTLVFPDRSELPGGAIFGDIEEWAEPPEVAMRILAGGRLRPVVLSERVGKLPGGMLMVHTPEARKLLEDNWYEPWGIEQFGTDFLLVRFSAPIEFERVLGTAITRLDEDGVERRYALYVTALPWGHILDRRAL